MLITKENFELFDFTFICHLSLESWSPHCHIIFCFILKRIYLRMRNAMSLFCQFDSRPGSFRLLSTDDQSFFHVDFIPEILWFCPHSGPTNSMHELLGSSSSSKRNDSLLTSGVHRIGKYYITSAVCRLVATSSGIRLCCNSQGKAVTQHKAITGLP